MTRHLPALLIVAGVLVAGATLDARQATPPPRPALPPAPPVPTAVVETRDARETRESLNDVLSQYPPSVREVLRIDPTLMSRPDYLATYPALANFLAQHPQVAHNPAFFVGDYQYRERTDTPSMEAARALRNVTEFGGVLLLAMTFTTGVILLVRTVIEHRRWQRALRVQTDLHTKLIDRFSSSDELLAYLQSPAGKLLTEIPSLPQAPAARAMNAPLNRIFWSVQAGIVIGALGTGLIYVGSRAQLPEVEQMFNGLGIVILTIGIGFTVSAAVSYFLSQRLGLVPPAPSGYSGEAPGS